MFVDVLSEHWRAEGFEKTSRKTKQKKKGTNLILSTAPWTSSPVSRRRGPGPGRAHALSAQAAAWAPPHAVDRTGVGGRSWWKRKQKSTSRKPKVHWGVCNQ